MPENLGALCSDYFVNSRLDLKMDLPTSRETVLAMFDRLRREHPGMDRFRRLTGEYLLESEPVEGQQRWASMRKTSVRAGTVNPDSLKDAYAFHAMVLDTAPYFLSISPLDVDQVEIMFGFDFLASGNHDAIVHEALFADTPLGRIIDAPSARPTDCRPVLGFALTDSADVQAMVEVKTRTPGGPGSPAWRGEQNDLPPEPLSVYLSLRKFGPVKDVNEIGQALRALAARGERLLEQRVLQHLLLPIREAIASSNAG